MLKIRERNEWVNILGRYNCLKYFKTADRNAQCLADIKVLRLLNQYREEKN